MPVAIRRGRLRHGERREHQPIDVEARIDGLQPEQALREEAGHGHDHHRHGQLAGDEHPAAGAGGRVRRGAAGGAGACRQPAADDGEHRRERGHAGGRQRDPGAEQEHPRVDRDGVQPRETGRCPRQHGLQEHVRERNGAGCGRHRQHETLDQHLAGQAAAAGAERRAHRELRHARFAAHQEQRGHVGARQEQHQDDRGEEREDRRPDVAEHGVLEPAKHGPQLAGYAVRDLSDDGKERPQLLVGLRRRRAGADTRDHVELVGDRPLEGLVRRGGGHGCDGGPRLGAARVVEPGRHHADDQERLLVDEEAAADGIRARRHSGAARRRG